MRNCFIQAVSQKKISNQFIALLLVPILLGLGVQAKLGIAAEGSGKRLADWKRLPAKIVSRSGGGFELQITNTDQMIKFCDLYLSYRVVNAQQEKKLEQVFNGFELETDATQTFQFPDSVDHADIAVGSVYANLACIAVDAGEKTDGLKPAAGCIAQNLDCDNLCLKSVSASGADRCQQRKRIFKKPVFDVSGAPETPLLKVVLANDSAQDLRCGGSLGLRAYKPGSTSSIQLSEDISSVFVTKNVGNIALQLKRSRLGAGYLFDFSKLSLALSCAESNTANRETLSLWNIGKITEPDTKTDFDWFLQ